MKNVKCSKYIYIFISSLAFLRIPVNKYAFVQVQTPHLRSFSPSFSSPLPSHKSSAPAN